MKRKIKIFLQGISIVIILALVLLAAEKIFIRIKLPDLDGRIEVKGLSGEASILRDRWGVPHITAKEGRDAFFALGYTIAQDRLFQMDIQRHLARGELSELLGPSLIDIDREHRTYLFRYTAEKYLERADKINPEALSLFDAFIDGVNRFIGEKRFPVEYTLLGTEPARFTRLDCLSMLGFMAYSFAEGIDSDSLFTMLQKDNPGLDISELFPLYSKEEPVTVMESQAFYRGGVSFFEKSGSDFIGNSLSPLSGMLSSGTGPRAGDALTVREMVRSMAPPFAGSNGWVIGPSRSATGGAILANDPHIALSNPSVWYEAHVKFDGYENYGYHLPVMPFPLLSHNSYRACGITMFENDDLDLYEETFDPADDTKVMYRGQWTKITTIEETIKVKGAPDVKLTIRVTPHGPVITDFINGYKGKPVSMCWVFLREKNPLLDFIYAMSTSKNIREFEKSLPLLASPGLNFLYADREGNIAWWAVGKVVIRPPHVKGDRILDGASGRDEWVGMLPFAMNPHLINPKSGIIVSANNQSTKLPIGPMKELRGYWVPTDRAARITEILSSKERWSLEELQKVQTDLRPIAAEGLIGIITGALEPGGKEDESLDRVEKEALHTLKTWDRWSDAESSGASIYHQLVFTIMREGIADELGPDRFNRMLRLHGHWNFFKAFMKDPASPFWDDRRTPARETREDIIRRSFKMAVGRLREIMGNGVASWHWGRIHTIEYMHPVGMQKPMNLVFNIGPLPAPGEAHHINRIKSNWNDGLFTVVSAPSTRRLVDMKDPAKSLSIMPSGNSGNVGSVHYDDQVVMYLKGLYRPMFITDGQIGENVSHRLVFAPAQKK